MKKRFDYSITQSGSFIKLVQFSLKLLWTTSKMYTIIRMAAQVVMPVLSIISTYMTKVILDCLSMAMTFQASARTVTMVLFVEMMIAICQMLIQRANIFAQKMQDQLCESKVAVQIIEKATSTDIHSFDDSDFYNKLIAATRDILSLPQLVWSVLQFISMSISLISSIVLLCSYRIIYTVLVIIAGVPIALINLHFTRKNHGLRQNQIPQERKKSYYQSIAMNREHAQEVRILSLGRWIKEQYVTVWKELFLQQRHLARNNLIAVLICGTFPLIAYFTISMDLVVQIMRGTDSIGDFTLYLGLVSQLSTAITSLVLAISSIIENQLRVQNIVDLDMYPNYIVDNGTIELSSISKMEFCNVDFSYPNSSIRILSNLSFKVVEKETIGIVGLNASGKSTIIKLLLRMYEPTSGKILINGRDIREYTIQSLRANFSVYFQEMRNYSLSLLDNLVIAKGEDEDPYSNAKKAYKMVCCEEIIEAAEKGLDTCLSKLFENNGLELSGGQDQRIALARVLIRDASVYAFDEPTSNLDPETERRVMVSIFDKLQDKIKILISHRQSTISKADKIIVLKNGSVIESGTHEELFHIGSYYAALFNSDRDEDGVLL